MRVVISYDISDDKRRREVAKTMEGYGYRVQYSVFECDLTGQQIKALQKALRPHVKAREGDSIRFYLIPADAVEKIQVIGNDYARTLGVVAVV
jgi:CRISPR-associated protein Cas2